MMAHGRRCTVGHLWDNPNDVFFRQPFQWTMPMNAVHTACSSENARWWAHLLGRWCIRLRLARWPWGVGGAPLLAVIC